MSEPKTALRFDQGKPELDYADSFPHALAGVARVSMAGRYKYDLFNYMRGAKSARESYNCCRRHMLAWYNGEDLVPDVSPEALAAVGPIHHLDAAIWNLMRLREELIRFPERDDRPHQVLQQPERSQLTDAPRQLSLPFSAPTASASEHLSGRPKDK